jgi:DNA-binding NtrC family response regulator
MYIDTNTALVIGNERYNFLVKTVFDHGYLTIVRNKLTRIMSVLKNTKPLVVIVDCNNCSGDVLELVLNIRDIQPSMPIIFFGETDDKIKNNKKLNYQNIYFIENNFFQLEEQIEKINMKRDAKKIEKNN